jgi:hypothetical protein
MYQLPKYQLLSPKKSDSTNSIVINSEFLDDIDDSIKIYKTENTITDDGYFYFQLTCRGYSHEKCLTILNKAAKLFHCTIDENQNIICKIIKPDDNHVNEAIALTLQTCTAVVALME